MKRANLTFLFQLFLLAAAAMLVGYSAGYMNSAHEAYHNSKTEVMHENSNQYNTE